MVLQLFQSQPLVQIYFFSAKISTMTTSLHFFNLPKELRIKVYEGIFEPCDYVPDYRDGPARSHPPFWKTYKKVSQNVSVLRVCQTMRHEALPVFYRTYCFFHRQRPTLTLSDTAPSAQWIAFVSRSRSSSSSNSNNDVNDEEQQRQQFKPELVHLQRLTLKLLHSKRGVLIEQHQQTPGPVGRYSKVHVELSLKPQCLEVRLWVTDESHWPVTPWATSIVAMESVMLEMLKSLSEDAWNGHTVLRVAEALMNVQSDPRCVYPPHDRRYHRGMLPIYSYVFRTGNSGAWMAVHEVTNMCGPFE